MDKEFYKNDRTLFILNNCQYCREYLRFIGILNSKLPLSKQIDVVEVSDYYDWNITLHPKISAYKKFLTGSFPVLFFEGIRLDSNGSFEELSAFMYTLVGEELEVPHYNKFLFKKDCHYEKLPVFGRRLVCE